MLKLNLKEKKDFIKYGSKTKQKKLEKKTYKQKAWKKIHRKKNTRFLLNKIKLGKFQLEKKFQAISSNLGKSKISSLSLSLSLMAKLIAAFWTQKSSSNLDFLIANVLEHPH